MNLRTFHLHFKLPDKLIFTITKLTILQTIKSEQILQASDEIILRRWPRWQVIL